MITWTCATLLALVCACRASANGRSNVEDFPRWTAQAPDHSKPLGGYTRFNTTFTSEIYHGVKTWGTCK